MVIVSNLLPSMALLLSQSLVIEAQSLGAQTHNDQDDITGKDFLFYTTTLCIISKNVCKFL